MNTLSWTSAVILRPNMNPEETIPETIPEIEYQKIDNYFKTLETGSDIYLKIIPKCSWVIRDDFNDDNEVKVYNNGNLHSFPDSIGSIKNLKALGIYDQYMNKIHINTIPDSIGNLIALEGLRLDNNKLTSIPNSIGNLINLKTLSLYGNKLVELPDSIGNLIELTSFDCSYNFLGKLPNSIGHLRNLINFNCSHNNISTIPTNIINCDKLKQFHFGDNPKNKVSDETIDFINSREGKTHTLTKPSSGCTIS